MTDETLPTVATTNVVADFLRQEAERQRQHAETMAENKRAVFAPLGAVGITSVVVSFDGCGDSGQIERVDAYVGNDPADLPQCDVMLKRRDWGGSEAEPVMTTLAEAIESLVYDTLEATHGGWQDNAGAYGEFTFNTAEQSITLDFNERYEDSTYTQHVF